MLSELSHFVAGLVETACDHIRHLHMKLSMDALELTKPAGGSGGRKRENPIITELIHTLQLLRNFMYNSTEVKVCLL